MQHTIDEHLKVVAESGYKLTCARKLLLSIFCENHCLMTAAELIKRVQELNPKINASTIYRNIDILLKLKLIKKTVLEDGLARYELAGSKDCHHHLICSGCGDIVKVSDCIFDEIKEKIEDRTNYRIESHNLELYGLCPRCHITEK